MKWAVKEAAFGDIVRVQLGSIWHYGIFASEAEVIQFGLPPTQLLGVDPADVRVLATDIDTFRCGGFPEVAEPSFGEKLKKRSPAKTVSTARSRIGEGGYNFILNNCEHFVYDCAFGKPYCSQTAALMQFLKRLPGADCYYLPLPANAKASLTGFAPRDAELAETKNETVRAQRYYAWKLLGYAMRQSYGEDLTALCPARDADGKWICSGYCISISHTAGLVAAAVSRQAVGVDVEAPGRREITERLARRCMNDEEFSHWSGLPAAQRNDDFLKRWTQKESLFKRDGGACFDPRNYSAARAGSACQSRALTVGGATCWLSVAASAPGLLRVIPVREADGQLVSERKA